MRLSGRHWHRHRRTTSQLDQDDDRRAAEDGARHSNSKPKRLETPAPFDATWELRLGSDNRFRRDRVLYEIDEAPKTVNILAIGIKDRNRLLIGGKEFK